MSNKCCKCGKEAKFYNECRYADKDSDRVYYCAECAIEQSCREGKIDDGHIIKYCSRCNTQLINMFSARNTYRRSGTHTPFKGSWFPTAEIYESSRTD